jgi:UDP-glucose 6-dehydrogenase
LVDGLLKIHEAQEHLREAIQTTLVKILKNTTKSVKVFDYIVKKLLVGSEPDSTKVDEASCFKSSSRLSLYLIFRKIYRQKF